MECFGFKLTLTTSHFQSDLDCFQSWVFFKRTKLRPLEVDKEVKQVKMDPVLFMYTLSLSLIEDSDPFFGPLKCSYCRFLDLVHSMADPILSKIWFQKQQPWEIEDLYGSFWWPNYIAIHEWKTIPLAESEPYSYNWSDLKCIQCSSFTCVHCFPWPWWRLSYRNTAV